MTPSENSAAPSRVRKGRVLLWAIALLVGFDYALLAFDSTWKKYAPDEYALRVEGCALRPRDIVFAGGSPVAEGIDPDIIGGLRWHGDESLHHYNLGLSGGTTSDIYFGLRHACPTAPKVIVYGCTASDFNDSRHEPHGVQSIMTWDDVEDWRRTRPDAGEWVARHYAKGKLAKASALSQHRFGIRMWAASECESLAPGSCPESAAEAQRQRDLDDALHTGRGFAPTKYYVYRRYDEWKAAGWEAPPFAYLARYKTGSHTKYLHRLLDWAAESGTEVILIDMPVTADLESRHPAEFAEYRRLIGDVSRSRGVKVLDGREARLDDRHFADLIHMNCTGTAEFSVWIRTMLWKLGEADQPRWTPHGGKSWAERPR